MLEGPVAGPTLVALAGLGGTGTTSVALEYAHRVAGDCAVIWYLRAENPDTLLSDFTDLARLLDPDDLLDRTDPVARVHTALSRLPERWLLLLDNLPSHTDAARWLPPRGTGRVLVTTRDADWPGALTVGVLPESAAVALLLEATGSADTPAATAVAGALGYLPLALVQAAAYVTATGRSLAGYLDLLRADPGRVLARGGTAPVAAAWQLSLAELARSGPGPLTLLRLLACLAPDDIPLRLLLSSGATPADATVAAALSELSDPVTLDDAVAGLRRHSLIGPPGETVSVHRLVQAVTLDQLGPAREHWRGAAAALLLAAIPEQVTAPAAWPTCAALLPHARVVLRPLSGGRWRLAGYLVASGDYAGARAAWQSLVDGYTEQYGAQHRTTLSARANLAFATGEAGDAIAARDTYAALLPLWQASHGATDPQTLTILGHLARWTAQTGDRLTAHRLSTELVAGRLAAHGPEDPRTLVALASLADQIGSLGDPAAARDRFAELVPLRIKVSGPEHPHTLSTWESLAFWTGKAGDPRAARDLYAALAVERARIVGPEHPDTLTARDNLARWTGEAGDPTTARDLYTHLLEVRTRVSGPDHPHTRIARANLAHWTLQAA